MTLTVEHLNALTLARYEFHLRARAEAVLPPFLGSTLRGSFGHALKAIACSMPHGDCQRCLLVERCLYPRLFEASAQKERGLLSTNQDAPRPFIFVPPLPGMDSGHSPAPDDWLRWRVRLEAGEPLVFGLSLLGGAIQDLPYVVYAMSLMAQHGFGAERASFALEAVTAIDAEGKREVIYTPDMTRVRPSAQWQTTLGQLTQARLDQLASKDDLTLRFITPTRFRMKGQLLRSVDLAKLVSSLSLRLSLLAETHGEAPLSYDYKAMIERAGEAVTRSHNLHMMALERFSNRRQAKLELDGFVGEISFAGSAIQELLPLIVAGEFLHVGSGTAFGLGRYRIVTRDDRLAEIDLTHRGKNRVQSELKHSFR